MDVEEESSDDDEIGAKLVVQSIDDPVQLLSYNQVSQGLKQLEQFATMKEPDLLDEIMALRRKFEKVQIKRVSKKKRVTISSYFRVSSNN